MLDGLTLFYWTLSSDASCKKQKHILAINNWASAIPTNNSSKSASQTSKFTSSHKSDVSSLTSGTSHSSAPSVLSNKVKIISHQALELVKVKAELAPAALSIYNDGGLSDNDEIRGMEGCNWQPSQGKEVDYQRGELACVYWYDNLHLFPISNSLSKNHQRQAKQLLKISKMRSFQTGSNPNGFSILLSWHRWNLLVKLLILGMSQSRSQSR